MIPPKPAENEIVCPFLDHASIMVKARRLSELLHQNEIMHAELIMTAKTFGIEVRDRHAS